jgi:hypothetical protein
MFFIFRTFTIVGSHHLGGCHPMFKIPWIVAQPLLLVLQNSCHAGLRRAPNAWPAPFLLFCP